MSNTLVTTSIVAKEALAILENMLGFSANVNRDFESEFTGNMARGYAPGQTINIKRPPRYTYRAGRVAVPQSTVESTVPLTLSQGGCDINFTSFERTLKLSQLERKIAAAIAPVCNEIDRQGLELARFATFNALNPTKTAVTTSAIAVGAITAVNQRLDEMGAPRDGNRHMCLSPALNAGFVTGLSGLFNSSSKLDKQYGRGMMVDSLGLSYAMDQNVQIHSNGACTVTGSNVNGANQSGATITVAATPGGTLTKGTIITFPDCYAVNPQSRQTTGVLAQFVVTSDVAQSSTSIPISPAMVTSGAFQNVSASPTTAAAWLVVGAASTDFSCSVGYHKDAFTLACLPMWAPPGGKGVIDVAQESDHGFNIKVTEFYDGINDNSIMRIDVLFGWAATYPELAVKYYL